MALTQSIVGGESYRARVLRDGPVAYWRLDELTGTFVDLVAGMIGTANGTITRGQTSALANGNAAVLLDGATGYISVPDAAAQNPGLGSYTFEAWVKRASGIAAGEWILAKSLGGGLTGGGGELVMSATSQVTSRLGAKTVSSVGGFADGTWHHVAMVMNRATATSGRCYIDGVASGSAVDLTTESAINLSGGAAALLFGKRPAGSFFNGAIDEIAIYTTALTAQQVAAHYGQRLAIPSGLRVGGTAAALRHVRIVSSGGVRGGGSATQRRGVSLVSSGGVRVSGAAALIGLHRLHVAIVGTGGVRMAGAAVVSLARGRSFSALPAVSQAIYTALSVPAVTSRAPGGVHDVVPQGAQYPLVLFEVSEARQLGGFGTKPGAGELPEIALRVHVYSQQTNLSQAQAILALAISHLVDPPAVSGHGSWAIFHDSTIDLGDQVVANVTVHELVAIFRLYVEEGAVAA